MSISHVRSIALLGLEGIAVSVETDLGLGLPNFSIVGLADKAVDEAKERVKSAFKNSHLPFPQHRVTVNLAPADLKKSGTYYDLPIAVSIAVAQGTVEIAGVEKAIMMGELSLGGEVRGVPGVLPAALFAAESGCQELYVPYDNAKEAALVEEVTVYPVRSLREIYLHLRGEKRISPVAQQKPELENKGLAQIDMQHIRGQSQVKRALEVAAAGGHNMLKLWTQYNVFHLN